MKQFFLLIVFIGATHSYSQSTNKRVEISKKFYECITKIKSNSYFNFIGDHERDTMLEIYDCTGKLDHWSIDAGNYTLSLNNDSDIVIRYNNGEYFLNLVDDVIVGHGFTLDTRNRKLMTYYFQDGKTIKQTSINK